MDSQPIPAMSGRFFPVTMKGPETGSFTVQPAARGNDVIGTDGTLQIFSMPVFCLLPSRYFTEIGLLTASSAQVNCTVCTRSM